MFSLLFRAMYALLYNASKSKLKYCKLFKLNHQFSASNLRFLCIIDFATAILHTHIQDQYLECRRWTVDIAYHNHKRCTQKDKMQNQDHICDIQCGDTVFEATPYRVRYCCFKFWKCGVSDVYNTILCRLYSQRWNRNSYTRLSWLFLRLTYRK